MADLLGGAVVGALVSEALKCLIKEAKKYKDFKPLSEELVSTMDRLLPLILEIESMQKEQEFGVGELKELKDTIEKARALIDKFPGVGFFDKPKYTKKIREINAAMENFFTKDLQLLQHKNQVTLMGKTGNIEDKVDGLHEKVDSITAAAPSVFRNRCSVPELKKVPVGFDLPLMKLKEKLLDVAVVNIVVTAPPGCGKTTLVTHLCHDKDVKEKFKHIFFCVVSSTPNFKAIVQDLLQHNGYQALTFNNNSQASNGLSELLEKLKGDDILLVLDDVWSGSESFLENFPTDIPNLKILVTSRSRLLGFGYSYHLEPLKDEYAETLLVQYASRPDQASPAQYKDLLQKILKRCNGFPLVIKVVGASLKNRPLTHWQAQVIIWSRYAVLDNPHHEVIDCLQPSFDALDFDLKQCFLDMGLFLEDQYINSWIIIDIWVELYGNGIPTEKEKIILCMKYLEDLAAHNLLDLVPNGKKEHEDGFYNEFFVTQHDILRELAIRQSKSEVEGKRLNLEIRENNFPDWCLNGPINASMLSISTDDLFSSNWVEMDCPNVEALVLNLSSSDNVLPSFIAGMKKLKVLIITNHGFDPERLSNLSCLSSLPNLKRIRLENVSVNLWQSLLDFPQLRLGSLEKLSFSECTFTGDFYDCVDIDISEALPSLQEIDIDFCHIIDKLRYWVSEAVSLKTLSITDCGLSRLPEAIGNLSKLEVLRLSGCEGLCDNRGGHEVGMRVLLES